MKKIYLIATGITYVILLILAFSLCVSTLAKGCKDLDEAGGLKALTNRLWEGQPKGDK